MHGHIWPIEAEEATAKVIGALTGPELQNYE